MSASADPTSGSGPTVAGQPNHSRLAGDVLTYLNQTVGN
jgi:hypothetical protein